MTKEYQTKLLHSIITGILGGLLGAHFDAFCIVSGGQILIDSSRIIPLM